MYLNKNYSNKLDQNESHEYYILTLDNFTQNPDDKIPKMLTFYIQENKSNIEDGEEIFSDPDVYVSKINKYPSNPGNSEWYSERYGNDILTISDIKVNDTFYVGIYCQFKCRYTIFPSIKSEIELKLNNPYYIVLPKNSRIYYYIYIPNKDYNEFNLYAIPSYSKTFRIYMSNTSASTQNTFKMLPSFINGYSIIINKESKYYCINCTYHIIIQSLNESTEISLNAYFQNEITRFPSNWPIYDSVKQLDKKCYYFELSKNEKLNSIIVFQIILYNGNGILVFHGWENDDCSYEIARKKNNSFIINGERSFKFSKNEYEYFDKLNDNYINKDSKLYFCYYSKSHSSYKISNYNIEVASTLQTYNFITPEQEITGYLANDSFTKYRIIDYSEINSQKKANISITLKSSNALNLFGYYSSKRNLYITKYIISSELANNKIIIGEKTSFSVYELLLKGEDNECYKIKEKYKNIEYKEKCDAYVIIYCDKNNTYCEYKLRVSISESSLLMTPKTTYYSTLPSNKSEWYQIIINDSTLSSLVIVLNSISGDAQLIVYKENKNETNKEKSIVAMSFNNDFIPDVVRITPFKLKQSNINGKYLVKIISSCFSTYSLYYYTTYEKKNNTIQVTENDVTSNIENGLIITDYFPNDIDYKIYSYTPNGKKEDIKIVLTSVNVKFSFKVFLNLTTFNFTKKPVVPFEEKISGFDWVSDSNGELLINSNDTKFSTNNPYYIVVYINEYYLKNDIDKNAIIKFYLGVTTNNSHFVIFEGLEQTLTLTDTYKKQDYLYVHNDKNKTFELSINVLSGEVDLFLNTSEMSDDKIKDIIRNAHKSDTNYYPLKYILNIKDYDSIILDKNYFDNYCKKGTIKDNNSCNLYIKVLKSNKYLNDISHSAQYIIVGKNSFEGEYLIPGIVKKDVVKAGNSKHYIIEEIQKRKGSMISLYSENGYLNCYVKILDTPKKKNLTFPNEANYEYSSISHMRGEMLYIPEKEFQKINSEKLKLIILVTVIGNSYNSKEEDIKFQISYSSDPKRINQNTPYTSFIETGEFHYYKLFFDKKTTNIYISLSNMNGDADLYLNYGDEVFPMPNYNDWNSTNLIHEYINLNLENEFFTKNNISSLEGYYILLIAGETPTSYTLFVSNYNKNVYPLNDNIPMNCKCQNKNDKCYFRYNDVYSETNKNNETEIIFVNHYLYGDGMMYAKVIKDNDLYELKDKFYDNFPDEKNSDFSTNKSNQKNYMKVKVHPNKYSKDSIILMTLICNGNSEVSVNTASSKYHPIFEELNYGRENIFYLKYNQSSKEQPENQFIFYKNQENNLLYNIHTYVGKAHVKVFLNNSYYDKDNRKMIYKIINISEFDIDAKNTYLDNSLNDIHEVIKNSSDTYKKRIFFSFIPKSDIGFFIKLLYDNSFVPIQIGKNNNFLITNNMVGYFDIFGEYSNIEFSFSLLDNSKKCKALVYIKINIINKDTQSIFSNPERSHNYNLPNENNYDYKMQTDPILNSLVINIDNYPKINKEEKKFLRAFCYIELLPIQNYYYSEKLESKAKIIVSAEMINNIKRIPAEPYQYIFNNITIFKDNDNVIKKKIFALERIDSSHTKMIIEISTCSGDYEFSLSNNITLETGNLKYVESIENGRKIIIIENLKDKDKHIYLSIWPKKNMIFFQKKQYLSYLLFYYSTSENNYQISFSESTLTYKPIRNGGIKMIIPPIKGRDHNNNIVDIGDYVFSAFITINPEYYNHMESVCYLTRYFDKVDPKKFFRNVHINNNNEINIKDIKKGQSYYVNILAKNSKTNELITFKPIVVIYGNSLFSYWKIAALVISIIFVVIGLIYLIKRIRRVEVLVKEVQNVTSGTVKSDSEMTYITPSSNSDNKL